MIMLKTNHYRQELKEERLLMEKSISLNGLKMRVVSTAEGGEVNSETVFDFTQDGSVVARV